MRRGSTSRHASMAASRRFLSYADRTYPPVPFSCVSTTPRRSRSSSKHGPPRLSPRRSSRTSTPERDPEVIAARKAGQERAQAAATLAQQTYDRLQALLDKGFATRQQLDQATDSLHENQKATEQAKFAYEQAVHGYTREERQISAANPRKAIADIESVQSIVDQMVVYAPIASQIYKRNVEPGEYVSPGVPLFTLIDLDDAWIHFDLREDLARTVKVGDRFSVRVPALGDRTITVEVRLIATPRRIRELARDTRDRRFRLANVRGASLSGRQGTRAAARNERVHRLASAAMKRPPRPRLAAGRGTRMALAHARSAGAVTRLRRPAAGVCDPARRVHPPGHSGPRTPS